MHPAPDVMSGAVHSGVDARFHSVLPRSADRGSIINAVASHRIARLSPSKSLRAIPKVSDISQRDGIANCRDDTDIADGDMNFLFPYFYRVICAVYIG